MTYEQGFSDGERAAWFDRKALIPRPFLSEQGDYRRGFVDGYTPRSATWARGINNRSVIEWRRESEAA